MPPRLTSFFSSLLRRILAILAWHGRLVLRLALIALTVLAILAAIWQFWAIPNLDSYRGALATEISKAAGLTVQVGGLQGGWSGIRPSLSLKNLTVLDAQKRESLHFSSLDGALSWWRLLVGKLYFSQIRLNEPRLAVLHRADGAWQLGGMVIKDGGASDAGFANWLLAQGGLEIRHGEVVLSDEREAAPIVIRKVYFSASNLLGYRRVSFLLQPDGLGAEIAGTGHFYGQRIDALAKWSGTINLGVEKLALAPLTGFAQKVLGTAWPEMLSLQDGRGRLQLKVAFADAHLDQLDADLALQDLLAQWQGKATHLPQLEAKARWRSAKGVDQLQLDLQKLVGAGGLIAQNAKLDYRRDKKGAELKLQGLDLAGLSGYDAVLPAAVQASLAGAKWSGRLASFRLAWPGGMVVPAHYQAEARLNGLGVQLPARAASYGGLDVDLRFDEHSGAVQLHSKALQFSDPELMPEALVAQKFDAALSWQQDADHWQWRLEKCEVANAETALAFTGLYQRNASEPDQMDFRGGVTQLPANRVYAYLPRVVGDDTIAWLKGALKAGQAKNARFEVVGRAADFPFYKGVGGRFSVDVQTQGVTLDYGPGWPALQEVEGPLRFANESMLIKGARAQLYETRLNHVDVQIPDLGSHEPRLLVSGSAQGPTPAFLRFVKQSPVRVATEGALDDLKADGSGQLGIKLMIPINNPDASTVSGAYQFERNQLDFGGSIPALAQASGRVEFSDAGFRIVDANAQALGGNVKLSGGSDAQKKIKLTLSGQAPIASLAQKYPVPLPKKLAGAINFQGLLQLVGNDYDLVLQSDLTGLKVDLPAPLGKAAQRALPFRLHLAGNPARDQIEFAYDGLLQGLLVQKGKAPFTGGISLGTAAPVNNPRSITVSGAWPEFDIAAWMGLQEGGADTGKPPFNELNLAFGRVLVAGKQLNQVKFKAQLLGDGRWNLNLGSKEVTGQALWRDGERPQVSARLAHLALPLLAAPNAGSADTPPGKLPAIDLQIEDLTYEQKSLGKLTVDAQPNRDGWAIRELALHNADVAVNLSANWQAKTNTSVGKFSIKTDNLGKFLTRIGYPEAMKKAPATFVGEGQWQGLPFAPQLPTLQGKVRLDVASGAFVKIEPGAGRFLSILSLQALPRRITLDFSDVFSEGFEFEKITGDARIDQGVATTDNLALDGSAAKVKFTGSANFVAGTQNLKVRITPILGDSVAIATAVVNPIVGAATYLVQKALQDPLGQLVSYDYEVTGTMQDPKIRKLGWFGP